jgi:hypothetical protein
MKLSALSLFVLLTLLAGIFAGPIARAGGGGFPPGTTPTAGPIEVFVQMSSETATPGGFAAADVVVVNSSPDVTVRGALRSAIVFADGTRQRLRFPQPLILEPDSAVIFQLVLAVPQDASLGEARLGVTAFVGYRPNASMRMSHVARDSDTFEVVAP